MNGAIEIRNLPDARSFLAGGRSVWRDFNFGSGRFSLGASAPDLVSLSASNIEVLGFDGVATLEEVSFVVEMDHLWKQGTGIHAHIHWMPTTADQGNVKWNLEYIWLNAEPNAVGDTAGASNTISVVHAANGVAWQVLSATIGIISGTGFRIGSQFAARLFRNPGDGADSYEHDAALLTVGLHVEVDTLGSRSIEAK